MQGSGLSMRLCPFSTPLKNICQYVYILWIRPRGPSPKTGFFWPIFRHAYGTRTTYCPFLEEPVRRGNPVVCWRPAVVTKCSGRHGKGGASYSLKRDIRRLGHIAPRLEVGLDAIGKF